MFLAWQVVICVSTVCAGLVSKKALKVVAAAWIAWTLFAVLPIYALWVGAFQLINIAITYGLMSSKK